MSDTPIKVALIEDDTTLVEMYRAKLELEGFEVKSAGDGMSGYELIESFRPDVALVDVMMPETTGLEMMSILRRSKQFDAVKVIVMTNLDDQKLMQSLQDMGISEYIVKAEATPAEVATKIHALVGR